MELTIGTKITLLRKYAGIQQKELAASLGITSSRLSDYEADKYVPGIDTLNKISSICKMHPSYFSENIPPTKYEQVLEDLEYAFYLSCLPDDVRRYQRELLKHAYEFHLIEQGRASVSLIKRDFEEKRKPHKDYFAFLKKLSSNGIEVDGSAN